MKSWRTKKTLERADIHQNMVAMGLSATALLAFVISRAVSKAKR